MSAAWGQRPAAELTPSLLGHLLISLSAPLISEQESLWDSGSLVPCSQPSPALGETPQHPGSLRAGWKQASQPWGDAPRVNPGTIHTTREGGEDFLGRLQLPWVDGFSQWDPSLLSCQARWLPEDLVWLQMFPLLTAPSAQLSGLRLPWFIR